ncbi:hypothetical protein BC628DRAFT_1418415 [Trametes gibbosa]|nr:hypothetical protein BC628DRAFT_1418415 [Trametes gibbosa]
MSALIHPAGKRFLMRKSSNVENMPPTMHRAGHTKKAEALVSAREASRRRRARVVSGSTVALRKIVQNAQRRASKVLNDRPAVFKLEPAPECLSSVSETQQNTPRAIQTAASPKAPVSSHLEFPRWLARPPNFPKPFDRANIDACGEGVLGVPHEYILRGLDVTGHKMWQIVQGAIFNTVALGHTLPKEVNVIIADHTLLAAASTLPNCLPTHVLAVWDAPSTAAGSQNGVNPATGRRKVRLVAVHNLVLAAYCANWFPMPSKPDAPRKRVVVNSGGAMGTQLTLPVIPLPVPHVDSFHQLLACLYTHKVSRLLDELVPVQKPNFIVPSRENPCPQNPHYIVDTGRRLGANYMPWAIVRMIRHVVGLWQNACHLGINDKRMWLGIDWSWDMLLTGLAHATGHPESVPRPVSRLFGGPKSSLGRKGAQRIIIDQPKPQYAFLPRLV